MFSKRVVRGRNMITVTVKISTRLLDRVDELVQRGVFPSRSEVIREGIRRIVEEYSRR